MSDRGGANWQALYKPPRNRRALALAVDIAERLTEASTVERALASAKSNTTEPSSISWNPYSVAQGDAGVALMFGCFDACFPDEAWDQRAHYWIDRAARGAEAAANLPCGLFDGLSGLAFTVGFLSRGGRRYQKLHAHLHEWVVRDALARCASFDRMLADNELPFLSWDLIAGLTGIAAYFLARRDAEALQTVLERLVALTHQSDTLPGWRTPAAFSGSWMSRTFPEGHLNCGLAHGIPGPLALLSLALRDGHVVAGQQQAIDRIAQWLSRNYLMDPWGVNWPSAVPLERQNDQLAAGTTDGLAPTHAAWCYGSPGIARALWLAGGATKNAAYSSLGLEAMRAVLRRTDKARALTSPAFCHGLAGLLGITLRFRNDVNDPEFTAFGRTLMQQLEKMHEPETLLGYRTTEQGGKRIDQPGLLDGAPGIAMVLLAACTDRPPDWDRLFLLS